MVILDTCAIIETLKSSPSYTSKTANLMSEGAYIMSVSFAEIACKIRLGKLELGISSRELFKRYSQIEHVEIIDIGANHWLDSIEFVWDENRDPADRIIVAFAIKNELPIVTTDKKIKKFYRKVIW